MTDRPPPPRDPAPPDAALPSPRARGDASPRAQGATPALAQWFAAKAAHPDALVFFRMGDFFELFFEDAEDAALLLDIALTFRGEHQGRPVPMCGVPVHAHEVHLARLVRRGRRVALCEQTETPDEARRRRAPTIRRAVVRVVTPGTATEEALLDPGRPAWLLALAPGAAPADPLGAAWLDVSTGAFETARVPPADLPALLARLEPAEVLAPGALAALPALASLGPRLAVSAPPARDPARRLATALGVATLDGFGDFAPAELAAAALAVDYLRATQGEALPRLSPPRPRATGGTLRMDAATRRSLELLRDQRGGTEGALLAAVDRTLTPAGGRELARRLADPLADRAGVAARHEAVAWLLAAGAERAGLRAALRGAPDMARALARLAVDRFAPRDLAALRDGLGRAEAALLVLTGPGVAPSAGALPPLLEAAAAALDPAPALRAALAAALAAHPPARLDEGGVVAPGHDAELDSLRALRDGAREAIAALQRDLAAAWGIAALRIRHHQQLGFLAEVPAAAGEALLRAPPPGAPGPLAPVHRQSLASAHRFTCAALAELDARVAEAGARASAREREAVAALRAACLAEGAGIAAAAAALAELDVHAAAAELAMAGEWCRPELTDGPDLALRAGRHPVVEAALARAAGPAFVPNDCDLARGRRLCLLTGPNMAGKSTYLRQCALAVVLAQAGLFVPARSARLGVADRLFSRVGGADDLAGGRSTFMVEMTETAAILHQATDRSVVVLDEVGRGTATWDGLAIAWAVLEALHDGARARTLFATHFRELTALAGRLPELATAHLRVREWKGEVVFLHEVGPGVADRSWGLHVARLAGVPRAVTVRAAAVLAALEARAEGLDPLSGELPLFALPPPTTSAAAAGAPAGTPGGGHEGGDAAGAAALAALRALDPDRLTPRAAQDALYRLRALLAGNREADGEA